MEVLKIRTSPDAEWQEIVALRGYTPVKGVDYYTEAEKSALIQEVIETIPRAVEAEYAKTLFIGANDNIENYIEILGEAV